MSAESKALLKVSLDIAQNNYPEMLYKSHLVNTGWVFSTIWYFVKGLLDVRTAAKVTTTNSYDIPKSLAHEISADCIPNFIKGGKYDFSKEPEYVFDLTPYGPLHFFATDGSKPSCFLEHWCMQHALPAPALQDVPAHAAAVAAVPPTPPEGEVAVTGILRHASDAGFEHARRRSLSGNDLHKVKAVILDLDGTLLATEALSEKVLTRVLSRLGATDGIPAPVLTPTLKLEMMGLPDAAWTKLVVNTLQLQDSLTPADLLSQWEAEMEELMGEVRYALLSIRCRYIRHVA